MTKLVMAMKLIETANVEACLDPSRNEREYIFCKSSILQEILGDLEASLVNRLW